MAKLLLLSIIFATIALPARAARMKNPRLGLRKTVISLILFNLFYVFGLVFLYGRL
jgi:predicted secreted protein